VFICVNLHPIILKLIWLKDFAPFRIKLITMNDEPELIRRAQKDPQAFGWLYDRYVRRIYAFVYHRCGDGAIAQDVTATTFEKALQNISRFRWQGVAFGAWLYRIARNELNGYFRRERHNRDLDWRVLETHVAPSHNGKHDALHAAFGALTDDDRELLTLRFFEDLSSAEVAQVLNTSVNIVYVRVHRALQRLRVELEKLETVEADHAK